MRSITSAEVLVVDDSLTDAELTIHALKIGEVMPTAIWISSADDALLYLFRAKHYANRDPASPRLILLDLEMPGIGGMGVLERVKQASLTKCVPIVVLSSLQDDLIIRKCYELGANSYLVKPAAAIGYFQLIAAVANYWLMVNRNFHEHAATSRFCDSYSVTFHGTSHATGVASREHT